MVFFTNRDGLSCDLMLDTGSSLGLLMKTTDLKNFPGGNNRKILGRGLNGNVLGIETIASKLILNTFEISAITAGITHSAWHNYASVGMEVMKNYTIVLNYCKAYAGFKKNHLDGYRFFAALFLTFIFKTSTPSANAMEK